MLTLNKFNILFWCFHCWLWTSKCRLGIWYSLTYMLKSINICEPIKKWKTYDFCLERIRITFIRHYIMRVTNQFVITAALLTTITQTGEVNNAHEKRFSRPCRKWNSIFRDNPAESSVNACIRGDKKKLYEIGISMEQHLIYLCFG